MSTQKLLAGSLVLMLGALPVIAIGANQGIDAVWWAGLVILALGAALPPLTRVLGDDDDEDEEEETEEGERVDSEKGEGGHDDEGSHQRDGDRDPGGDESEGGRP